jgi:hypothetical protein
MPHPISTTHPLNLSASDPGDAHRQALDWLAGHLRWNRTLKELRARDARLSDASDVSSTTKSWGGASVARQEPASANWLQPAHARRKTA